MNAIAQIVSDSLDLDRILGRALDKTLDLADLSLGAIWVFDEHSGELPLVAQVGLPRNYQKALEEEARIVFEMGPRHGTPITKPLTEPGGSDSWVWGSHGSLPGKLRCLCRSMVGRLGC
jgi:GAF domain-containing protein